MRAQIGEHSLLHGRLEAGRLKGIRYLAARPRFQGPLQVDWVVGSHGDVEAVHFLVLHRIARLAIISLLTIPRVEGILLRLEVAELVLRLRRLGKGAASAHGCRHHVVADRRCHHGRLGAVHC